MIRRLNQVGAGHILAALVVVLVVVVGFTGYRVMQANDKKAPAAVTATNRAQTPDAITSTADVEQASKSLDSDQIDVNLDDAQLDADLNSLL